MINLPKQWLINSLNYATGLTLLAILSACSTISFDQPKSITSVYPDTQDTNFGKILGSWNEGHPGENGFYPLSDGMDALGARLRLIEGAERSIDAQYFLMKDDDAGELFAGTLLRAADRGVRVRFLLDDVFTTVEDDILALLNQHPNIEIRLYNPVSRRGLYYLNYAGDFKRANRRMHSKSITADNAFTIIGGRNIADEYFQLRDDSEFLDYDVLALGHLAADVSDQFDDFWNSSRAIPMEALHNTFSEEDLRQERAEIDEELTLGPNSTYRRAMNSEHMLKLVDGTGIVYSAPAVLLHDGAAKLENPIDLSHMTLINELGKLILEPTQSGLDFWQKVLDQGRSVTIVTNSLASTNHIPVHSGYSRYRKRMLEMGASIYEARANAVKPGGTITTSAPKNLTLHTKLIVIDERYLFVGSLNLDPRSIEINAEMGVLIDSPLIAKLFLDDIDQDLAELSYKVVLDDEGRLQWLATIDGEEVVETKEPLTSCWRRFLARAYRVLPESQL
jgi:putative cardiolipin synthase